MGEKVRGREDGRMGGWEGEGRVCEVEREEGKGREKGECERSAGTAEKRRDHVEWWGGKGIERERETMRESEGEREGGRERGREREEESTCAPLFNGGYDQRDCG
eukprot:2024481-Rhodomonas_salina.1